MAITKKQLEQQLQNAFDRGSDVQVDPKSARRELAEDIAAAIVAYVVGRSATVTGTSATGGPVSGTAIIKGDV